MARRLPEIRHPALRFPARVLQSFTIHRGTARAASLSYTSLLALVPLLAVILSISKVFVTNEDPERIKGAIDDFLRYAVPQLQMMSRAQADEASADVFARLQESIERVNAGALGSFGAITLVTVGISLLSAIETALNDIWGVRQRRSLGRRVVYYWAGVTLGPLLIFFSIGLSSSEVVTRTLGYLPGGIATAGFRFLLPGLLLGLAFTMLYWTMPNTTVRVRSALAGGVTAGALFQMNNLLSALYFSQVVKYSRVYGSLGAIPVFMIGLYLAWAIILIGAEVACAADSPQGESAPFPDETSERERLALEVARVSTSHYLAGRGGASIPDLGAALAVPIDWINRTLGTLIAGGILVESTQLDDAGNDDPRYLPARPPEAIRALDVVAAVRGARASGSSGSPPVEDFLRNLVRAEDEALGTVSLERLSQAPRE